MHPEFHLPFDKWILKIKDHLAVGESTTIQKDPNKSSYFDAMPMFWKNMNKTTRLRCIETIEEFHEEAKRNNSLPWTKYNILSLSKFVNIQYVHGLRVCYDIYKKDKSVISGPSER